MIEPDNDKDALDNNTALARDENQNSNYYSQTN